MIEEPHPADLEALLSLEKENLERVISRSNVRRTQLLAMQLPVLAALCWTGYNFCVMLNELLRSAEPTPKSIFEICFWGIVSALVFYVVAIVTRERSATVERGEEAERRLFKVSRRLQQVALELAKPDVAPAHPPTARPSQGTTASAPIHPTPSHPAQQPKPASAPHHPAAAPQPAKPRERAPIVLDLDSIEEMKECPMCCEMVKARAKVCRYCRHQFEAGTGVAL